MIKEVKGDLIAMTLGGSFNVIAHCCNCFCKQKRGIAKLINEQWNTSDYGSEHAMYEGDINKLGQIESRLKILKDHHSVHVVNMYGQYHWSDPGPYGIPIDYDALRLCFRKLNVEFKSEHIGLPGLIGAGLAGGDPIIIKAIISQEMTKSMITIVYPPEQI